MFKYVVLVLIMLEGTAAAGDYGLKVLDPTLVSVDTYKNEGVHDPYIYPDDADLSYGAVFRTKFDVIRYYDLNLYFDSSLHFDQSSETGRIVHAGWMYEAGSRIYEGGGGSGIQVYRAHHSRHVLDRAREGEGMHFPTQDAYGIRWILLSK